MTGPVASVVVPAHDEERTIGRLLAALCATPGLLEVVVDNGSTDETLTLLRRRGDCSVVESVNDGYGAGMN